MKVCSFYLDGCHTYASSGTFFTPLDFQTEDIFIWLNTNATPSPLGPDALSAGVDKVISLYPDDPSAGSPFGTGNETFGTGPAYKREAAICMSLTPCSLRLIYVLTGLVFQLEICTSKHLAASGAKRLSRRPMLISLQIPSPALSQHLGFSTLPSYFIYMEI